MDASEPLPAYNAAPRTHGSGPSNPTAQPPDYTFPTRFEIGGSLTDGLLVDIPQIKGHLALLDAFANLKKEVEETDIPIPDMPFDKEKRWAWFVGLAVERCAGDMRVVHNMIPDVPCRFDKWCRKLYTRDTDLPLKDTLPPVDVLMVSRDLHYQWHIAEPISTQVWHSYMLNPRYGSRALTRGSVIESFAQVVCRRCVTTTESQAPERLRTHLWEAARESHSSSHVGVTHHTPGRSPCNP